MKSKKSIHILIAEDDEDDKLLIIKAFEKCHCRQNVTCVGDGVALIEYLHKALIRQEQAYEMPDIILLDLNMPRKDGKTTLQEIKANPDFQKIPVIIFSTSSLKEDISYTYQMGSNSFITKPGSFEDLVQVVQEIERYWSSTVELPT